jgi:hypothetical protein
MMSGMNFGGSIMARRWKRAAILLGVGLVVGCDTDPRPVNEAKKIEEPKPQQVELKPPAKPAQSDPAAAQLLKEVINAHTGGKLELLEKLKACSYIRTGTLEAAGGRWPATWQVDLVWPDRFRVRSELQMGATVHMTFSRSPAGAWRFPPEVPTGKPEKQLFDAEYSRTLTAQFHEDSVNLLFPLVDPKTVTIRAADETIHGQELLGLHVWTPALDYALLGFDKKTKLLTRIVYHGREEIRNVVKEVVVTEHQEFSGVKLASKLYVKANGRTLADWTKLAVTTGVAIDPKVVDNP